MIFWPKKAEDINSLLVKIRLNQLFDSASEIFAIEIWRRIWSYQLCVYLPVLWIKKCTQLFICRGENLKKKSNKHTNKTRQNYCIMHNTFLMYYWVHTSYFFGLMLCIYCFFNFLYLSGLNSVRKEKSCKLYLLWLMYLKCMYFNDSKFETKLTVSTCTSIQNFKMSIG